MKLGIFAKTFAGADPNSVLAASKAHGFATVQYNMACSGLAAMPDVIEPEIAAAINLAATQNNVEIAALSATYNMIHPDEKQRALGLQRLEILAAQCSAIGTSVLTLCTGTRHATDQWHWHAENGSAESWRDLLVAMEKALAIAERHNIFLAIEPELANVVNSAAKAKDLIDQLQSSHLKIVFDAANLFEVATLDEQKTIISSSINLLADHIVMAHAKDRLPDGSFTAAGQGCLDYGHYISCLKAIGFNGSLVTHGLDAGDAAQVCTFLKSYI